ncbi:HMA2 domain-containing protein, partial [Intestinibacter sp.]
MNRNLITALILASGFLLTSEQEKDQYKPQLPNFKDILEVKHSIKGRIRIQCKVLKGNQQGEQALLNTFSQIPGIIDISVNPCIGTVIIKYNEETIQPMLII